MKFAMLFSTVMVSGITPIYIINHGIRASIPLFFALICAVVGTMIAD